jgi:2-polyprenyl-6-methoxyphenol hydroxylase-like FAD-dependent oxidoreductase
MITVRNQLGTSPDRAAQKGPEFGPRSVQAGHDSGIAALALRYIIVGAGPSRLNLALALIRRNVQCRLISDAGGPGEESRAMVVQARTLEFYGQRGFAEEVVEQGVVVETAHVGEGGSSGSQEVLSAHFKMRLISLGRTPSFG